MKKLALLAAASLLAGGSFAQSTGGDAERGKSLYMNDMCWTCHGTEGAGSPYGPKLAPGPMAWEGFSHQVRHPRGNMPPYGDTYVSDRDLADIYAYVGSIKPGPAAKDIPLLRE